MDGVLADFDTQCFNMGIEVKNHRYMDYPKELWSDSEKEIDNKVQELMSKENFFRTIPLFDYTKDFWDYCNSVSDVKILTAKPKNYKIGRPHIEKLEWCRENLENFSDDQFICCLRSEKQNHADKNSVLVDDLFINCKSWEEAGGIPVLHTDIKDTYKQLEFIYLD